MNRSLDKPWLLSIAMCLVVMLSAFTAVTSHQERAEDSSSDVVELEECEGLVESFERRRKRKATLTFVALQAVFSASQNFKLNDSTFKPTTERAKLNGTGSYLRI